MVYRNTPINCQVIRFVGCEEDPSNEFLQENNSATDQGFFQNIFSSHFTSLNIIESCEIIWFAKICI